MNRVWNARLAKVLFIGAPLVSIFLIDGVVTDPVNSPKLFVLGILAFGVAGALAVNFEILKDKSFRIPVTLVVVFLATATFVLIRSSAPISQSLYGVYGRNNGYLAYVFLGLVLLGSLFLDDKAHYQKVYFGLLTAGIVNVFYCTWVTLFGDFLSWSNPYGSVLGTFGNPNFIGAFLGMFTTGWIAIAISPKSTKRFRYVSLLVLPLAVLAIYQSSAIQGRVLLLGGAGLVLFFWIKSSGIGRLYLSLYSIVSLVIGALAVGGALQKGPLTELIYKTSVSLRGQYWLSGWNTGLDHPLSGVGFDGLGDWYRRMRDIQAITLPGPNTVVNAAHNVPLDLFAFGGLPLAISYLLLMGFTGLVIVKKSIKLKEYEPIFVGLSSMWVCYQIQSLISINQLGLAVWGWLLSGAVVGYAAVLEKGVSLSASKTPIKSSRTASNKQYFGTNISIGIGMLVGALLAVPPLSADMKWMSAQKTGSAEQIEKSLAASYLNPPNSFKYLSTVIALEQSNLNELAYKYALEGLEFNPDSFDLWRAFYSLKNSSPEDRLQALKKMKELDPLNPDVTK